jgi:hypothetical protein
MSNHTGQVARDLHVRPEQPGEATSSTTKDHWANTISSQFFTPKEEDADKTRLGKLDADRDRLPTLDWLRCVDNSLRAGLGEKRRLKSFRFTKKRHANIKEALEKGELKKSTLDRNAPVLTLCTDKESKQFIGCQFLVFYIHLLLLPIWDGSCHGLWNLAKLGLKDAGYLAVMQESQVLVGWRAGIQDVQFMGRTGGAIRSPNLRIALMSRRHPIRALGPARTLGLCGSSFVPCGIHNLGSGPAALTQQCE